MRSKKLFLIALSLALVSSFIAITVISVQFYLYVKKSNQPVQEKNKAVTVNAVRDIESFLRTVEKAAENIAHHLSAKNLSSNEINTLLRTMLEQNQIFYGTTVAFKEYGFSKSRRLFAPYFYRDKNTLQQKQVEDAYDYTGPEWEWFSKAMIDGSRWSRPYLDVNLGNILMVTYSAVFFEPNAVGKKIARGVVTVDISVDHLADIVKNLKLGANGFAEIVNVEGDYLYAPNKALTLESRSFFQEQQLDQQQRENIKEIFQQRKKGYIPFEKKAGYLLTMHSLEGTNWYLLSHSYLYGAAEDATNYRRFSMLIIVFASLFLIFLYTVYLAYVGKLYQYRWWCAIYISAISLIGVAFLWQVILQFIVLKSPNETLITGLNELQTTISRSQVDAQKRLTEQPIFIKIGLFIDSMKFTSYNDIHIAGTLWQKNISSEKDNEMEITIVGVSNLRLFPANAFLEDNERILVWRFEGSFRTKMQYVYYPLVHERISVSLSPTDINKSIILVPDLESYSVTVPELKPAISTHVYLPGWEIMKSYFSHYLGENETTFGLKRTVTRSTAPLLRFHIEVRRNFIDAFITKLTPLLIAAIMAFLTVLISTRNRKQVDYLHTGTGFGITISATIFFVIAYTHLAVRQQVVADEIFYLEYFYFTTYAMLLTVCIHSIVLCYGPFAARYAQYVYITKTAFFPVFLMALMFITLFVFY